MKIFKLVLIFVIGFYISLQLLSFSVFIARFKLDSQIIDHKEMCAQYQALFETHQNPSDKQTKEYIELTKLVTECAQKTKQENIRSFITNLYFLMLIPVIFSLSLCAYIAKKMK